MPPQVREVLGLPELALRLLAGAGSPALDAPVRWVATSELGDPGPYLEGGELLLTTGMRLVAADRAAAAAYVDRLAAARVVALGFGVGPVHDLTPPALVAAAEAAGLPLLEVPLETPFIAVSKAVSRLLAAEEYEQAARGLQTQRELIRAALGAPDPVTGVLDELVRHLGGFALALDATGALVQARPADAAARAAGLREQALRLRPKGLLATAALATATEHVVLAPLGVHGRTRGFLAVGSGGALRPGDQAAVNLAVSLLSLDLARGERAGRAADGVRAAALRLLLAGSGGRLPMADLGWSIGVGPVRVLVVRPKDAPAQVVAAQAVATEVAATEVVQEALPGAAVAAGILADDPTAVVVVAGADTELDRLRDAVGEPDGALLAAGVGDAVDLTDAESLARSLARARRALAAAGRGVRSHDELGGGLQALLDPVATDAWADAMLAPLDVADPRGDLAATVAAWLTRHGQVDAAAADLGVHRHTVRHRLRRAETLLGRSFDDPAVRAELYLALSRRPSPTG